MIRDERNWALPAFEDWPVAQLSVVLIERPSGGFVVMTLVRTDSGTTCPSLPQPLWEPLWDIEAARVVFADICDRFDRLVVAHTDTVAADGTGGLNQ